MRVQELFSKCDYFCKLAQDSQNKNAKQFRKNMRDTLFRVAAYLPSQYAAKQLFDKINVYRAEASHSATPKFKTEYDNTLRFKTLLDFYKEKASVYGIQPTDEYFKPLNVLLSNLNVILDGRDFSGYKQFVLVRPGESPTIELD